MKTNVSSATRNFNASSFLNQHSLLKCWKSWMYRTMTFTIYAKIKIIRGLLFLWIRVQELPIPAHILFECLKNWGRAAVTCMGKCCSESGPQWQISKSPESARNQYNYRTLVHQLKFIRIRHTTIDLEVKTSVFLNKQTYTSLKTPLYARTRNDACTPQVSTCITRCNYAAHKRSQHQIDTHCDYSVGM